MKRYGSLWPQIIDFANLEQAARQAQRGKRQQANVLAFNFNLEGELLKLQTELTRQTYHPGPYTTFHIYEPKKRMISAAPYRDRVAHHALCNVIGPIFEKSFIADSYANRTGYGTHRALRRFTKFARSSKYVLQCDIRQYFPSIDHEILKELLRRKIKCGPTLRLLDTIIDASNPQDPALFYFPHDDIMASLRRRRGLPIGNLTSQFFANIYLNGFDHFIKERLRVAKYLRYVDDFALFSDDKEFLAEARCALEEYLCGLRLKIHPVKSQLCETRRGANFVGFRVLPEQIRIRSDNLRRARHRLREMQENYHAQTLALPKLQERLQSWIAHLRHGDTWRLREAIFTRLVFARG